MKHTASVRLLCSLFMALCAALWAPPGLSASGTDVLDLDEVAAVLRTDKQTARTLADSGELPGRPVGAGWRVTREALLQWLAGSSAGIEPLAAGEYGALRARGPTPESASAGTPARGVTRDADSSSANELFLRDSAPLLKDGQWSWSLTLATTSAEREQFVPEAGAMAAVQQSQFLAALGVRYGLTEDLQLGLDLPLGGQRNIFALSDQISTSGRPLRFGSASLLASYSALREGSGWPGVTLNATAAPFGEAKSAAVGLSLTKSYDPVALYLSGNYARPLGGDSGEASSFAAMTLAGGFVFAVNQQLSLSAGLSAIIGKGQMEPASVTAARYSLQLGVGVMALPGLYIEPHISVALNGQKQVTFGVSIVH